MPGGAESSTTISFSAANVTVSNGDPAGGLAGYLSASVVRNSYALGDVTGVRKVGGLLGQWSSTAGIRDSFSRGAVVSTSGTEVGGFIGADESINNYSNLSDSFWNTETSGQATSAGGSGVTGKTTTELTSLSTFNDTSTVGLNAAWDIVDGWEAFDADNNKVWGLCSGVNDGYPYLLWEYSSNPCPTNNADTSGTTDSSTSITERASSAGIHLDAGIEVGSRYSDGSILAEGEGLARGQAFSVTLNPGGQILTSGTASRLGYFSTSATLPAGLAPGTYTLTLSTSDPAGNPLVLTERFGIDQAGLFTTPQPATTTTSAADDATVDTATEQPPADTEESNAEASNAETTGTTTQGEENAASEMAESEPATATNPDTTSPELIPGWLVVTASTILIVLVAGGIGLGIYRARQARDW